MDQQVVQEASTRRWAYSDPAPIADRAILAIKMSWAIVLKERSRCLLDFDMCQRAAMASLVRPRYASTQEAEVGHPFVYPFERYWNIFLAQAGLVVPLD